MLALGYFTFTDLIHDRWRSLLTIFSLAVVVFGYLLLASLSQAINNFGKQTSVTQNLLVIASTAIDPMESSLEDSLLITLKDIAPDSISRVYPVIFRHMNIQNRVLQVRAVPLNEMSTSLALNLVAGDWPNGARELVVGEGIAKAANWKPDSVVNIYGTDFKITGLVRSTSSNAGVVWMTHSEGQKLFGTQRGYQIAYVVIDPKSNPEAIRAILQADQQINRSYSVYLENSVQENYLSASHNLITLSGIFALLSLTSITLGIYTATSLSLTERSHDILLLRLIGFTQEKILQILVSRAFILTSASYGLGIVIAALIFNYQNTHTSVGFSDSTLTLILTVPFSLIGFGLSIAFAFFGVWLTSSRIASTNLIAGSA